MRSAGQAQVETRERWSAASDWYKRPGPPFLRAGGSALVRRSPAPPGPNSSGRLRPHGVARLWCFFGGCRSCGSKPAGCLYGPCGGPRPSLHGTSRQRCPYGHGRTRAPDAPLRSRAPRNTRRYGVARPWRSAGPRRSPDYGTASTHLGPPSPPLPGPGARYGTR